MVTSTKPGTISHRAFALWLLAATFVVLLAVGALNWYVDPTGVTGRVTKWRVADNAEVRSEKLDLYEALEQPPRVVLLGSSRTMKFDPVHVRELTGEPAFNAAVSGGVPQDALLFTRLLEEEQGEKFPHLVWGLDVDAFRNKELRAGLSTDPRMARFADRGERLATRVAAAAALTELQTLKATVRSLRAGGAEGDGEDGDADGAGARAGQGFSPEGFQRWSLPFPRTAPARDQAVRRQIGQYASFIFERDAYTGIEDEPLDEFREVVRIANEHGDVPTIFLTPYHPLAERILERHDIGAREREVRERLEALQEEGELRFRLVDYTNLDSFSGDPAEFYDGVHMTPANTGRILEHLHAEGLLAPPR